MPINVEKKSLDKRAADWIRDAIIEGRVKPSSRLTEQSLASDIGLSRSTVRTALQRLAGEGLVTLNPYSGWGVAPLSLRDAQELYSLRAMLEGMGARLAAGQINPQGKAKLKSALRELERVIHRHDRRATAEADLALHREILELSGHSRLVAHCTSLSQSILIYVMAANQKRATDDALLDTHVELVEAVCSGDPDLAERTAKIHILEVQNAVVQNLLGITQEPDEEPRGHLTNTSIDTR